MRLGKLLEWIFPPKCLFCAERRAVNEDGLCADCAALPTERVFRYFNIKDRRRAYTLECRATKRYKGPFCNTLHRFKFQNEAYLAKPLAKQMALAIKRDQTYDCITAVPVSRERLKERGYDQSVLLAEALSEYTGIPYRALLTKTKHNRTQHFLPSNEREKNVHGAYAAQDCTGMRVLLVDDILTTGVTAKECARVLYRAGAADVSMVCCALSL
ncbi:MAG: ComF family protein [Clostridia bacterium]|nr:ComF family protein [Clostridia bacterium]